MSTARQETASAGGLRTPFLLLALVAAGLVVAAELAVPFALGGATAGDVGTVAATSGLPASLGSSLGDAAANAGTAETPPGAGIRYLALVDGLVLFTLLLLALGTSTSQRAYARWQGLVTLVVSVLWALLGVALALLALARLLLMVGLLLAPPFGTIAYLVLWGSFPVGRSAVVLGLLLFLKLALVACLVAAQPRFLRVKGLMVLLAASVLLQVVLGLVQGFLPVVLVSIGDDLWAIVTAVVAVVWSVVLLVSSVPAIVNALRVSRALAPRPAPPPPPGLSRTSSGAPPG